VWFLRFHKWTVAGTGFLVQASMPRLGETNKGSPKFSARTVAQATCLHFEREVILLRREGARLSENSQGPLFHCSSSRLGEKGLAWARGSLSPSLSKTGASCVLWCEWSMMWLLVFLAWTLYFNGLRDDASIIIWGWGESDILLYCVWIGKHEMYDWLFIHDISTMRSFWFVWWHIYKVWLGHNSMLL